jgi:glyoxylase-like metal-dependent hydrolase (beta-lactamase superfamily II)
MAGIRMEFKGRPDNGETMAVADGVSWLRMPLPWRLGHINLWLLRDGRDCVIVDTGIGEDTCRDTWEDVFAGELKDANVSDVVVTHMHPDHAGCAGWLVDRLDTEFWMTREEYLMCRVLMTDTNADVPGAALRFYHAAGFSDEQLATFKAHFGMFGKFVSDMPRSYRRLRDRERPDFDGGAWEILIGRGHSPEHACLFDAERNVLIAGDQLLPAISPNVSVWPTEPGANPLGDFFDSIDMLEARLPEDVLVLPAHGPPFRGAHVRLEALRKEHTDKLNVLLDNSGSPRRAADTFDDLFGRAIDDGNRVMATGEALAHLHYLVENGDMVADVDDDHVTWFSRR